MTQTLQMITSPENLNAAWRWFRNDKTIWERGMPRKEMERNKVQYIIELRDELEKGHLNPGPLRRFTLTKGNGKPRDLVALTLKDKIAQRAFLQVLLPGLEQEFHSDSFGYRPGRNVDMAVSKARTYLLEGKRFLIHTDIFHFFDEVPLEPLKQLIKKRLKDKMVYRQIFRWLDAHATHPQTLFKPARGIPQGGLCKALHKAPYVK